MNKTIKLQLSKNIILREEPKYYNSYIIFNYKSCDTVSLDHIEYNILEMLSQKTMTKEDLLNEYRDRYSKMERIDQIINKFIQMGIIVESNSTLLHEYNKRQCIDQNRYLTTTKVPILSFPTKIDITLTRRCNMKCVHCNVSAGDVVLDELKIRDWKNIFDQLDGFVFKIQISGGEPTLYHGFSELIEYLGNKRFHKTVLTNAYLLDDKILRLLSKYRVGLGISLDGATSDVHDEFRKFPGSFNRTIAILEKLQDYGILCTVSTTLNNKNAHQLEQIFNICYKFGVKILQFGFIDKIGRGSRAKEWDIPLEETQKIQKQYYEIISNYQGDMKTFIEDSKDMLCGDDKDCNYVFCKAGTYSMAIDADGTIFPCTMGVQLRALPIGNVREQPLNEQWFNEKWRLFRGDATLDKLSVCGKCLYNKKCTMKKCRMRSILNGDIMGRPYKCPL